MRDAHSPRVRLLCLAVSLPLALMACSSGEDEAAPTVAPSADSSPASLGPTPPSASPSPSPSPTPSPTPLSPFEDEPAVQALRAFYVAAAKAVNAGDLALPELAALSTPTRRAENARTLPADAYLPGPNPFTPVSVTPQSASKSLVVMCAVSGGWVRTSPAGQPVAPAAVSGQEVDMVRQEGVWRVDGIYDADPEPDCQGVAIVKRPFS